MKPPVRSPQHVFISYSQADDIWRKRILIALKPILRAREVDLWSDARIAPGSRWQEEIDRAIQRAGIALLLVSHNFLGSEYIVDYELPAVTAAEKEGLKVLWIAIGHSNYARTGIAQFQALNSPSKPLDSFTPSKRNAELTRISEQFELAIGKPQENGGDKLHDPAPYIKYIREQTGLIELSRISDSKRSDVVIDKLWIPSKVRVAIARPPAADTRGKPKPKRGEKLPEMEGAGQTVLAIDQAVNQNRLLLIRGEAGSGKSLLLKRIAWALVREKRKTAEKQLKLAFEGLPLWVQISALDKFIGNHPELPLQEFDPQWIPQFFAELAKKQPWPHLDAGFFAAQLQDPNAILLLDGLDEASSRHGRERIAQLFKKAAETFNCRIIVTTRPEAGLQIPSDVKYAFADLQELDDADIAQFIKRWAANVFSADAKKLDDNLKKLAPRSDLRKLARNPQMLTILAILSHGNRLPEHRAAALDQIVTVLAARHYHSHLEAETFIERVSFLALGMILRPSGKYQIELETAAAEILAPAFFPGAAGVATARNFLEEAQIKSGILTLRGSGDLVFSHKLFQEFLAAKGLTNETDTLGGAIQIIRERQSPEVIRFLPGKSISGNNRIKGVVKALIDDALKKDLETQAYTAGIVASMQRDGFELGESANSCYAELLQQANRIFDKKEAAKIEVKIRLAAAEALAQGGQLPPLPQVGAYWIRIEGTKAFRRGAQKKVEDDPNYDPEAFDREEPPARAIPIAAFEIGKYPVTVNEYQIYLADDANNGGAKPPAKWDEQLEHPNRPVVYVSWHDANEYCAWVSQATNRKCRLPSEEQWEYAARGNELRKYPWGSLPPSREHANYDETGLGHTTPVGLFPAGATPEGVLDMAGNVWEWTASNFDKERKTLRGGTFYYFTWFLRAANRSDSPPVDGDFSIGFRCLRECLSLDSFSFPFTQPGATRRNEFFWGEGPMPPLSLIPEPPPNSSFAHTFWCAPAYRPAKRA